MAISSDRRPLKTRQKIWAQKLARFFVRSGLSPNQMSMAGLIFAFLGAFAYLFIAYINNGTGVFITAAIFIQLRLLANMLDGLMAVEEEKKTALGVLFNEIPDRGADILLLIAAGYAAQTPWLGATAALLAVLTAYIRALGASLVQEHDFSGPMAKPHRMFALTVGSLLTPLFPFLPILPATLAIIVVGSAATLWRRTAHLAEKLKGRQERE